MKLCPWVAGSREGALQSATTMREDLRSASNCPLEVMLTVLDMTLDLSALALLKSLRGVRCWS